jgi:photosystem II stability/assembly factor-like uncharacterized protein
LKRRKFIALLGIAAAGCFAADAIVRDEGAATSGLSANPGNAQVILSWLTSSRARAATKGSNSAQVEACGNLPAAGTWQNVTPPGTSSRPAVNGTVAAAIIVDPFDSRKVWLGTGLENSEIWRSDNCGATWTRVNTGPGSVGDNKTFGGVGDGAQWSMQADTVDPGVLYAVSGYGAESLWKTTDGGYSWVDVLAGTEYERHAGYRFVNNVSIDPTDHRHVVVSTHGECTAPYQPSCIAETKDGGSTWKVLSAPEGWTEGGGLVLVKGQVWVWCGPSMKVTNDGGNSWLSVSLDGGGSCEAEYTIRSFVPATNGKYYLGSRDGVLRSTNGETWERIPGTKGAMVMIAQGARKLFAANQWQPSLKWADLDDDESWNDLPAPPQISQGTDGGIPFLAYDDAHGILYASLFSGGVARMVVP